MQEDTAPGRLMNPGTRTALGYATGYFGGENQTDPNADRLLRGESQVGFGAVEFVLDDRAVIRVTGVDNLVIARGPKSEEDRTTVDKSAQFVGWEHGPHDPSGRCVAYRFVSDLAAGTFTVDRFDVAPDPVGTALVQP